MRDIAPADNDRNGGEASTRSVRAQLLGVAAAISAEGDAEAVMFKAHLGQ